MSESSLKTFERPDEVREFPFGRFDIIYISGVTLGRTTYVSLHVLKPPAH